MLRAVDPAAAGRAPPSIPEEELWPELDAGDFELGELAIAEIELDDDSVAAIWSLYDRLWTDGLLVPLEQSCDAGILLPAELREARLRRFPIDVGARLEATMRRLPKVLLAALAMHVYWTLRCCRARRTGNPELVLSGPNQPPSARI